MGGMGGGWEALAGEGISDSAQHMAAYWLNSDRFWKKFKKVSHRETAWMFYHSISLLNWASGQKVMRQKQKQYGWRKQRKKDLGPGSQNRGRTGKSYPSEQLAFLMISSTRWYFQWNPQNSKMLLYLWFLRKQNWFSQAVLVWFWTPLQVESVTEKKKKEIKQHSLSI